MRVGKRRRNARQRRTSSALIYRQLNISYGEYRDRAARLANALYEKGLRRGDRVGILAQNSPAHLESYAACELSGLISASINYRMTVSEIFNILKDCAPAVLIFDSEYTETVAKIRSQYPELLHFIAIGAGGPDWAEPYEAAVANTSAETLAMRAHADDTAYLIYTSGTTGLPKGAMRTHRSDVAFARMLALEMSATGADRILLVMPFYHIGAKCSQLAFSAVGATTVLHRSYDIRAIAETIHNKRVTVTHLAPIMVQDLLDLPDLASFDHACLRLVKYASAPMAVAQLKRALAVYGPIFMQVYGMSETGVGTVLRTHDHIVDGDAAAMGRLASAGQPSIGSDIRVVRPDGSDCDVGEPGEVLIKGAGLMTGYWNNHVATSSVLKDGWVHSGDIGSLDTDRFLYVLDRKKDMIISGGENIYPREVEEAIYNHPAVSEVAVIGVPDACWGESVKAYVVKKLGAKVSEEEIVIHCRTLIASYKKPKHVVFVDTLPRLANKKIDKKQLRAAEWAGRTRNIN